MILLPARVKKMFLGMDREHSFHQQKPTFIFFGLFSTISTLHQEFS